MKFIQHISPIGQILLLYFLLLECFALLGWVGGSVFLTKEILLTRLLFLTLFVVHYFAQRWLQEDQYQLLCFVSLYACFTLLYKETYFLNRDYPKVDEYLIGIDGWFFGFQPSLVFSEIYSSPFFSELMFFGYFSYYLMPLATVLLVYLYHKKHVQEFTFIILGSFLVYYCIYILVPAVGPQYYFPNPQGEVEAQGLFGNLIKWIQKTGEKPTAAFPSSHVGIGVILLLWLYQNVRKYVFYFLSFVVTLCFSTVYIKAHYAVDVVAGILSAPIVYYFNLKLLKLLQKRNHYAHFY